MRERGRKQGWGGGGNCAEEKTDKHICENLKAQERGQRKKIGIRAKNESNDKKRASKKRASAKTGETNTKEHENEQAKIERPQIERNKTKRA